MSMLRNPKRRKLEKEEESKWSNLCNDVLQMVLERLSATDFERAKAVCLSWRSASRETVRKQNLIPWLILFPYERSYGYSCGMSNPADKNFSVYKSRSLGVEFTQSRCLATCGSWLLMCVRHRPKMYILNPLTRERISLPPMNSRKLGEPVEEEAFCRRIDWRLFRAHALRGEIRTWNTEKAILWVDERSKDYMVLWSYEHSSLFYSRKGHEFWNMFPYAITWWEDMLYKGHMLYILTRHDGIQIFDLSGDSIVAVTPYVHPIPYSMSISSTTRIAVTPSGEFLLVRCYNNCNFYVYKMMSRDPLKWDELASLGDQALILDLGITLPAKDIQGVKTNSIYFSGLACGTKHIFIFNLATRKVEPFVYSSTRKFFDARWFLPSV